MHKPRPLSIHSVISTLNIVINKYVIENVIKKKRCGYETRVTSGCPGARKPSVGEGTESSDQQADLSKCALFRVDSYFSELLPKRGCTGARGFERIGVAKKTLKKREYPLSQCPSIVVTVRRGWQCGSPSLYRRNYGETRLAAARKLLFLSSISVFCLCVYVCVFFYCLCLCPVITYSHCVSVSVFLAGLWALLLLLRHKPTFTCYSSDGQPIDKSCSGICKSFST